MNIDRQEEIKDVLMRDGIGGTSSEKENRKICRGKKASVEDV